MQHVAAQEPRVGWVQNKKSHKRSLKTWWYMQSIGVTFIMWSKEERDPKWMRILLRNCRTPKRSLLVHWIIVQRWGRPGPQMAIKRVWKKQACCVSTSLSPNPVHLLILPCETIWQIYITKMYFYLIISINTLTVSRCISTLCYTVGFSPNVWQPCSKCSTNCEWSTIPLLLCC